VCLFKIAQVVDDEPARGSPGVGTIHQGSWQKTHDLTLSHCPRRVVAVECHGVVADEDAVSDRESKPAWTCRSRPRC